MHFCKLCLQIMQIPSLHFKLLTKNFKDQVLITGFQSTKTVCLQVIVHVLRFVLDVVYHEVVKSLV